MLEEFLLCEEVETGLGFGKLLDQVQRELVVLLMEIYLNLYLDFPNFMPRSRVSHRL